jgi:hypothetical protein
MLSTPGGKWRWIGIAAILLGCNSTEPQKLSGLNGNFGSTAGGWLGLSLREAGGNVTGTAWSGAFLYGATVTGTYQPPNFDFQVVPRVPGFTPAQRLMGTFEGDTLRGEYVGNTTILELARIDTVPTGLYTLHLTGAISADLIGRPVFTYLAGGNGFAILLDSPGPPLYQVTLYWSSNERPPAGVYPLSFGVDDSPRGGVYRYDTSSSSYVELPAISATLWLDVSTRRAMIGRFEFFLTDVATGGAVTARANFSAGCTGTVC